MDIESAKSIYDTAVKNRERSEMYVGANHSRMSGELQREADAAASYIRALEAANELREKELSHSHRKPGEAV